MGNCLRKNDWPECLAALIADRLHTPFQWGVNDCGLFVADAVLAITGTDPAASMRGTYTTAAGATAALAAIGAGSVAEAPAVLLAGMVDPINPKAAKRGDVVQLTAPDGSPMLGVCLGTHSATPGASGLILSKTSTATAAWHLKTTTFSF